MESLYRTNPSAPPLLPELGKNPCSIKFLKTISSLILVLATSLSMFSATERPRPNILFIMVDDLGWTDLGCYGSEYYRTPSIDKFAADSLKFTQAYAASPLCSPPRAAALTGLFPDRPF